MEYGNVAVHCNCKETKDGALKRHAEQSVHHTVYPELWSSLRVQMTSVFKNQHNILPGLREAGDGVKSCQAADKAVHGRVQVFIPNYGHHNQKVFTQTHNTNDEKDLDGNLHLVAVCGLFSIVSHDGWSKKQGLDWDYPSSD